MPDYECCKFRGSLTALDATTGAVVWKTYTVGEPKPRGKSTTGKQLWGPAGAPIWSAPTIDAKRGLIYAATGNAYADPAPKTSDAIVAFDSKTGKIRWVNQIMPDTWILGCSPPPARRTRRPRADDAKFGDESELPEGRRARLRLLRVARARDESGRQGRARRRRRSPASATRSIRTSAARSCGNTAGAKAARSAASGVRRATASALTSPSRISSRPRRAACTPWISRPASASGTRRRSRPSAAPGPGCSAAQSAALTSIPGVVFAGSADGAVRAYASDTGKILWTYDTNRDFATVNNVKANGGSIDGPGPVVADGMLYVTAGNAGFVGTPGNVLLAFALE